jgi:hypothetical protein
MGDLVGSEAAGSAEQLHISFNQAIRRQNLKWKEDVAAPLTITLGDEFQGLFPSLVKAGRVLRDLRLELLSQNTDCRFALGTVELRSPLNPKNAWNMMGAGLARTREALNERLPGTRYRFVFHDHPDLERLLEALGAALTLVETGWTRQQMLDVHASLSGLSAAEIAKKRNVSVHSVYKVRSSGNFDTYLLQWDALQKTFEVLDERYGMAS